MGTAIPLYERSGKPTPKKDFYFEIDKLVLSLSDRKDKAGIKGIFLNVFYKDDKSLSLADYIRPIESIGDKLMPSITKLRTQPLNKPVNIPEVKSQKTKIARVSKKIKAVKASCNPKLRPFLVADIESLILNDVLVPYAAVYLALNRTEDIRTLPLASIKAFFSEDHQAAEYEECSALMLAHFIKDIVSFIKKNLEYRTIFIHNISRFDRLFVKKRISVLGEKHRIKGFLRNKKRDDIHLGDKSLIPLP